MKIKQMIMKRAQRGAEMVEYALVVALIALALVFALGTMQVEIKHTYEDIGNALANARPG